MLDDKTREQEEGEGGIADARRSNENAPHEQNIEWVCYPFWCRIC
jgi:hypothetical protein